MHLFAMNYRKCDGYGCGHFGASRGSRKHLGVDMACPPGTEVGSPVRGQVTKIGYPYGDDPTFRYVQIVAEIYQFRIFYVEPDVAVGDYVELGETIGWAQTLLTRYPEKPSGSMTSHVHFEIMDREGNYIDPTPVIVALRGTLRDWPV